MVLTHAVVDIERWLQGKAERVALSSKWATNVTDYVAADGSNNVAVTADIQDMAGLQAAMASPSPEDTAAEERHGVVQPTTRYIEK
jgi:carbohydrate-binding DOMON domain-containing protein